MNQVLDFYGTYGTESALEKNRGVLRKIGLMFDNSKHFSLRSDRKRIKIFLKEFEKLSTERITDKPIKVPYSLREIKVVFSGFEKMVENKDKMNATSKEMEKFYADYKKGVDLINANTKNVAKAIGIKGLLISIFSGMDNLKDFVQQKITKAEALKNTGIVSAVFLMQYGLVKLYMNHIEKKKIATADELDISLEKLISIKESSDVIIDTIRGIKLDRYEYDRDIVLKTKEEKVEYIKVIKDFYEKYKEELNDVDDYSTISIVLENGIYRMAKHIIKDGYLTKDHEGNVYKNGELLPEHEKELLNLSNDAVTIRNLMNDLQAIVLGVGTILEDF